MAGAGVGVGSMVVGVTTGAGEGVTATGGNGVVPSGWVIEGVGVVVAGIVTSAVTCDMEAVMTGC